MRPRGARTGRRKTLLTDDLLWAWHAPHPTADRTQDNRLRTHDTAVRASTVACRHHPARPYWALLMWKDKGLSQLWWVQAIGRPENPPWQRCCPVDAGDLIWPEGVVHPPRAVNFSPAGARLDSPAHHLLNQAGGSVHTCWVNGSLGKCLRPL